jgi:sporulation protein YlmC with PRC-barrel domain
MHTKILAALLVSVIAVPALAQDRPAARSDTTTTTTTRTQANLWRASKLVGLNVYNDQNEKLGDISEVLLDKSGKVDGVVIGVGGFLGIGQSDIKVEMSKLKFVDEPVRTSATTTSRTTETPAGERTTTTTTGAPTTTARSSDRDWYPDHAILSGVTKDQLKAMPQFKY